MDGTTMEFPQKTPMQLWIEGMSISSYSHHLAAREFWEPKTDVSVSA